MKYVSTYLMLVMSGNDGPSGRRRDGGPREGRSADVDAADLKRFLAGVEGKDPAELMAAGGAALAKFAAVAGGGGGGAAALLRGEGGGEEGGGRGEEIDMAGGMHVRYIWWRHYY